MGYTVTTPPATEPLTLQEAKDYLRVTSNDDDNFITALIVSARQMAEKYCNTAFITQTITEYYNGFPPSINQAYLLLTVGNVQSVTFVKYKDGNGDTQTLSTSLYVSDIYNYPARIGLSDGSTYPTTRNELNVVWIEYTAGFGSNASDVPDLIKQAMYLIIGDMYENRADMNKGWKAQLLPPSRMLLNQYKSQTNYVW